MLGKRFRKGFVNDSKKWKKSFFKVKESGKKYFFINIFNYSKIYNKISFSRKKTRQYYIRNLNKKMLFKNYKDNFDSNLNLKKNPLFFLFKNYTVSMVLAQEYGKITDFHLEMIRKTIKNYISKKSLIFLRLKPYLVMLKRSAQVRMGGGKASKISKIFYPVYPGCVIFEVYGVNYSSSFNYFNSLLSKLPVKIKLIFLNNI